MDRQRTAPSMNWLVIIQSVSAACAVAAAVLWFRSANIGLPKAIRNIDYGYVGSEEKPVDDLDQLTNGLRRQSRFSGYAAVAAGCSALAQGFAIVVALTL